MSNAVACPHCAGTLNIPANLNGAMVKCPLCAKTFDPMPVAKPIPDPEPSRPYFTIRRKVEWTGRFLCALGLLGLVIAINTDATAPSGGYGEGRVYNIGLLNIRQNWVIVSSLVATCGVLCWLAAIFGKVRV